MKLTLTASVAALALLAAPAFARDGVVEKCFVKEYEGAVYDVKHRKIMDETQAYEYVGTKRVHLVRYPAVYVEEKYKVRDDRYVLKQVACK